jgi:uncharacterized protein (DUF342 family)
MSGPGGMVMFFSGKTIEEALSKAEAETGQKREDFVYEVSRGSKKGFFKSADINIEIKRFKEHGKIGYNNGQFIYIKGDIPPVIIPSDNVEITVNGRQIKTTTQICENDNIQFKLIEKTADRKIDLEVSSSGLEAYLHIQYIPSKKFLIPEYGPVSELHFQPILDGEDYPPKFTSKEIQEKIQEFNIKFGIRYDILSKAVEGGRYLIASGRPPEEPVDDKIKYFFTMETEHRPVEVNGKVDYFNNGEVEYVKAGSLLASKQSGNDGKIGYDVFGKQVLPGKRNKLRLIKGPGCDFNDTRDGII